MLAISILAISISISISISIIISISISISINYIIVGGEKFREKSHQMLAATKVTLWHSFSVERVDGERKGMSLERPLNGTM